MPTPTYKPIANITLATSALTVTFSNINQTYKDLVVVGTGTTANANTVFVIFNGETSAFYNSVEMRSSGTTSATGNSGDQTKLRVTSDTFSSSVVGDFVFNIMDYSSTNKHKSTISRSGNSNQTTSAVVGRWGSTSAITSMTFSFANGTVPFNAGSTFSVYGIDA